MSLDTHAHCESRERLENLVQHHLKELAELANKEAGIIKTGDKQRILEIDKIIENTVGEKERCMGALTEHRHEHGC